MDNIREKLVELIDESGACFNCFPCDDYEKEEKYKIADHLLANGVTVQEWISVKDRLPEENEIVVGWCKDNPFSSYTFEIVSWNGKGWVFVYAQRYVTNVTHWMPLPKPPKGE